MEKKILIIDDNDQDRKVIKKGLEKAGYQNIALAETGEAGAEKAESERPDLVICDTMLPGISGFDVCRRIREALGQDNPKIIIVTGSIDAVDAVKAKQAGADDYCVKTANFLYLMETVKKLI